MLQRLPIVLAQVKAGNNSERLLNKIRQIVYSCSNQKNMDSENSNTSEPYALILKLTNKLDLRSDEKGIALSNRSIYYKW